MHHLLLNDEGESPATAGHSTAAEVPPPPVAMATCTGQRVDTAVENQQNVDGDNHDIGGNIGGAWLEPDSDDESEKRNFITRRICGYVFLCMPQDVIFLVISCVAFFCCLIDTFITTAGFSITNGACPMSSHYSEIGYMEYGSVQLLCEGSTYANMVCQLLLMICFLINWIVELRDKQCWLMLQMGLLILGLLTTMFFLTLHILGIVWWCEAVGRALKPEDHSHNTWYFLLHCYDNLHIFDGIAENYHLAPLFNVVIAQLVFSSLSCLLWIFLVLIGFSKWRKIREHLRQQQNYDE